MTEQAAVPDSILERVRKLLTMAEGAGVTDGERDNCNRLAADMMAKHGIDELRLSMTDPGRDELTTRVIPLPEPYAKYKGFFLTRIMRAMRGNGFVMSRRRNDGTRYAYVIDHAAHLYGYGADLERAEVLWTSLLVQMAHGLAAQRVPSHERSPKAYRRAWVLGFKEIAAERIEAAEARAENEAVTESGTGMELVLASRKEIATRKMTDEYPDVKIVQLTVRSTGYDDGAEAGRRADIGSTRVDRATTRGLPQGARS